MNREAPEPVQELRDVDFVDGGKSLENPFLRDSSEVPDRPSLCAVDLIRVLIGVSLVTALFDLCIYRGSGSLGWAVFLAGTGTLYLLAAWTKRSRRAALFLFTMLIVLAFRLAWLGWLPAVFAGVILLIGLAMTLRGFLPTGPVVFTYPLQTSIAGAIGSVRILLLLRKIHSLPSWKTMLAIGMPTVITGIFAMIFVQANPDLLHSVQGWFEVWMDQFHVWFEGWQLDATEFVLLGLVAYLSIGLLLPIMELLPRLEQPESRPDSSAPGVSGSGEFSLYSACRNTLVSVIVLFSVYLIYEFLTLWFRDFPEGFYYAGYAHAGAAWLTAALALATVVLSGIFQAPLLHDPRIDRLRRLAWTWSSLNLVLAITVYNRLLIYVRFNGMTAMRTVGFVGITTVLVGFVTVICMIARRRNFGWLIERHLWTFCLALYLLAVLPIDWLVYRFNSNQILQGNLPPAVQITEHELDLSAWLVLFPLVDCDDEIIRDGIQSRLAEMYFGEFRNPSVLQHREADRHWTGRQLVEHQLRLRLRDEATRWEVWSDPQKRERAWTRFKDYAWQWY